MIGSAAGDRGSCLITAWSPSPTTPRPSAPGATPASPSPPTSSSAASCCTSSPTASTRSATSACTAAPRCASASPPRRPPLASHALLPSRTAPPRRSRWRTSCKTSLAWTCGAVPAARPGACCDSLCSPSRAGSSPPPWTPRERHDPRHSSGGPPGTPPATCARAPPRRTGRSAGAHAGPRRRADRRLPWPPEPRTTDGRNPDSDPGLSTHRPGSRHCSTGAHPSRPGGGEVAASRTAGAEWIATTHLETRSDRPARGLKVVSSGRWSSHPGKTGPMDGGTRRSGRIAGSHGAGPRLATKR